MLPSPEVRKERDESINCIVKFSGENSCNATWYEKRMTQAVTKIFFYLEFYNYL